LHVTQKQNKQTEKPKKNKWVDIRYCEITFKIQNKKIKMATIALITKLAEVICHYSKETSLLFEDN